MPFRSTIHNQDDCIAINKGSNIVFQRNSCTGGHGISIVSLRRRSYPGRFEHADPYWTPQGSISSDVTVSGITIKDNTITNKCVRSQLYMR